MTELIEAARASKCEALITLLDDDTPLVREAVSRELHALGGEVASIIHDRQLALNTVQWEILRRILFSVYEARLRKDWPQWTKYDSGTDQLEYMLGILAVFQNGPQYRPPLSASFDRLAETFADLSPNATPAELARFLFRDQGFECVEESCEDADAANLSCVIETRRGLPISLVCLYMLLGKRQGLDIAVCNLPGKCYARFRENEDLFVVDCANGGAVLDADELLRLQGPSREAAEAVLALDMDAGVVARRILSALAFAYRRAGRTECSLLMVDLLRQLEHNARRGMAGSASR